VITKTKNAAIKTHRFLTEKRIHWLVYGVLILYSVNLSIQFFYPGDRITPFSRIDGIEVGGRDYTAAVNILREKYDNARLQLQVPNAKPKQVELVKTGFVPEYAQAVGQAIDYPIWQRFIPFSLAHRMLFYRVELPQHIDDIVFNEFANEVATACAREAENAAIEIQDGQVRLRPAKDGQKCEADKLRKNLQSLKLTDSSLRAPTTAIRPQLTDDKVAAQFTQAKAIVEHDITLGSPAERWKVPREIVASWLTVTSSDHEIKLAINADAVKKYLAEYRGKTYIAPGQTTVHVLDGLEVSRNTALAGQGIDTEVTSKRIADGLLSGKIPDVIWTQLAVLPPSVVYDRQYTQTNAGLQALIEQWDRDNAGRYGILVRDLSGRGLNAELNADRDFVTASTYKQFLAYAVMHKIEAGEMSFDDGTSTGLTVRACIDEMILHSTNPCAIALQNQAGWSYVHNFIRGQFPSTILDNGASSDGDKHSTVRDEVTFQTRLNAGSLEMSDSNHAYLLDLLKRQVYRGGIPVGVPGVTVANKVGFYNGYKHDIAIIYGPRGTYQLGIMSYGGADWRFADLSRRVAELMNR